MKPLLEKGADLESRDGQSLLSGGCRVRERGGGEAAA
jgi:hypothetical protein